MTKTDEIALLTSTIAAFGPHSYLGPWLSDYRLELEADIRLDLPVSVASPARARREAAGILEAAKLEAADIRQRATEQAKSELEASRKECSELRAQCRQAIARITQYL